MSARRSREARGHTLVEFALAIALIVVLAVPIFSLYSTGQAAAAAAERKAVSVLLAREILEEAAAKAFEEPGTTGTFGREAGEGARDRRTWDDVDDYDGYSPGNTPLDIAGNPLPEFTGWSISVTVENVADTNFGSVQARGSTNFKRIAVRVSAGGSGASDALLETVVGRR